MGADLTEDEKERIVFAIREAEGKTSGEIRVHVVRRCRRSPYDAAVRVFEKLGMTGTRERNGVLLFVALKDRQFAVIGDCGIHEKVDAGFWDKVRDAMVEEFRIGDIVKGVIGGVKTLGEELARHFPRRPDDRNELPDELSAS